MRPMPPMRPTRQLAVAGRIGPAVLGDLPARRELDVDLTGVDRVGRQGRRRLRADCRSPAANVEQRATARDAPGRARNAEASSNDAPTIDTPLALEARVARDSLRADTCQLRSPIGAGVQLGIRSRTGLGVEGVAAGRYPRPDGRVRHARHARSRPRARRPARAPRGPPGASRAVRRSGGAAARRGRRAASPPAASSGSTRTRPPRSTACAPARAS